MRFTASLAFIALFFFPIDFLSAEIYQYIDSSGTIHFTNVPTDPRFRRIVPEEAGKIVPDQTNRKEIDRIIDQVSRKEKISPALIKAIIRAESNFEIRAVSSAGAQGLMQLMPKTAEDLKLGNPFDPSENIEGGTRYLRYLLDRFDHDLSLAIAAYHAGPGTVARQGGIPPIKETKTYLKQVLRFYDFYLKASEQRVIKTTPPEKNPPVNHVRILNKNIFARSNILTGPR